MSSVAICTDSSALLPAATAERHGVIVVPLAVALDGKPFSGDVDLFYERVAAGARATTSQPSPGDFLEAYEGAAARGATEVLSIHLDARVSGTVRSAELVSREAPIPVTVVDSGAVSFGVGVCVRTAASGLAAGARCAEVAREVRRLGPTLENAFVATGAPGSRFDASTPRAVLGFADGAARPFAATEGESDATGVIAGLVGASECFVRVAVGHAAAVTEPAADELARALVALPRVVELERYRVGPTVGAHTGPQSFGAFWWPADP